MRRKAQKQLKKQAVLVIIKAVRDFTAQIR